MDKYKIIKIVVFSVLIGSIHTNSARGEIDYILDQSQENVNYGFFLAPHAPRWQSFTSKYDTLAKVSFKLGILAPLDADIRIEIATMTDSVLWEKVLDTSTWTDGWIEVPTPTLDLVPSEEYRFGLYPLGDISNWDLPNSNSFRAFWRGHTTSGYDRGITDTWPAWETYDYAFRTLAVPEPAAATSLAVGFLVVMARWRAGCPQRRV